MLLTISFITSGVMSFPSILPSILNINFTDYLYIIVEKSSKKPTKELIILIKVIYKPLFDSYAFRTYALTCYNKLATIAALNPLI